MEIEGTLRLARVFCPARDRNVPMLLRDPGAADSDGVASASAPEALFCLDYGVRCTGWLCPHFAFPRLPTEGLIAEAMETERRRGGRGSSERRSILERALREMGAHSERPGKPRVRERSPLAAGDETVQPRG
jgi:hypothetical protein